MQQTPSLRSYGRTGIQVSALGLGAAQLGDPAVDPGVAARLLDRALEAGITLIDTAPSYGDSEARLGRLLGDRRQRVVISTKLGYGVPGVPDWTGACIAGGIDLALTRLDTDWIDIVHLHSCPADVLARDDILVALARAKAAGKVRAIAYSGENDALAAALREPLFDGVMASLNLFDQRVIADALPNLDGRGFITKRPLANAPWRFARAPSGHYAEAYWHRWQAMRLPEPAMSWGALALRFAAYQPGVASAILGTASLEHLADAVGWIAQGPLPDAEVAALRAAFIQNDRDWTGQV